MPGRKKREATSAGEPERGKGPDTPAASDGEVLAPVERWRPKVLHADAVARPPDVSEAAVLGLELARGFGELMKFYRGQYELSEEEAREKADQPASSEMLQRARHGDPEQLDWWELRDLAEADPTEAQERWGEVKQWARDYVRCGFAAAHAVGSNTPWERAVFAAVRDEIADEWQPRGGLEWRLVETLAQAQVEQWHWMTATGTWLELEQGTLDPARRRDREVPRLSITEGTDRAFERADRWNRIFLRTLRAMRDLRRYAPAVHIECAGQVNIGGQQVNQAVVANGNGEG